jgi:hypothetical protein
LLFTVAGAAGAASAIDVMTGVYWWYCGRWHRGKNFDRDRYEFMALRRMNAVQSSHEARQAAR